MISPLQTVLGGLQTAAAEAVERPDPGLARGRWEAPAWVFYAIAAAAVLALIAWVTAVVRTRRV